MTYSVALYDSERDLVLNPEWNYWPKDKDGFPDYMQMDNSGGMSLAPVGNGKLTFRTCTLDSYELEQVDLIKIDVQGADLRVLDGARNTIRKYRPIVVFEYSPDAARLHGDSQAWFMEFFAALDYKVTEVGGDNYSWQDFVAEPK